MVSFLALELSDFPPGCWPPASRHRLGLRIQEQIVAYPQQDLLVLTRDLVEWKPLRQLEQCPARLAAPNKALTAITRTHCRILFVAADDHRRAQTCARAEAHFHGAIPQQPEQGRRINTRHNQRLTVGILAAPLRL